MSDYPDWYGQPQFPRYGGAKETCYNDTVPANVTTTLIEIIGKGVVYNATLEVEGNPDSKTDWFYIYTDGNVFYDVYPNYVMRFNRYVRAPGDVYVLCYDEIAGDYEYRLSGPITFDSSFKITFTENNGNTPDLSCCVRHALIEG